MHVRRLATAAVLSLASLSVALPAGHAAVPQCNGTDATIVGSDQSEKLFGTEGADVVVLGAGDDIFAGKGGDDLICGGTGYDRIYPGAGNDTVLGEDGDDTFYEGPGDDHLDGGAGRDRISYTQFAGADLRLDARIGTATSSNGTDTFSHVSYFTGSPGSDTLIGSDIDQRIDGNGGAKDVIYGLGGNDQLGSTAAQTYVYGGDGNDRVGVRSTDAHVQLGAGNDKLFYGSTSGTSSFAGGPGADAVLLRTNSTKGFLVKLNQHFLAYYGNQQNHMPLYDFENVVGSLGDDYIVGNALPNFLDGYAGDDYIYGLDGNDTLYGGGDFDIADGGRGADYCRDFVIRTSC